MKFLGVLVIVAASAVLTAEELIEPRAGVALAIPDGWVQRTERVTTSIYPPKNRPGGKPQRRIHIVLARDQSSTLEDAMNTDVDNITKRAPEWGSWNDRNHLMGARPVVTLLGTKGLAAEFGWNNEGKKDYSINKFYFRNREGKIFLVCAHVYGDQAVADEFEKIILEGLTFAETNGAEQTRPNPFRSPVADGRR